MSAALKLNGITLPVLVDGAAQERVAVEDFARAFDGTPRSVERSAKRRWRFRLGVQTQENAHAFRQLISGAGHHWSFDADLYSSKGLVPVTTAPAPAIVAPGSLPFRGHGKIANWGGGVVADCYTSKTEWAVGTHAAWTLLASLYRNGNGYNDGWNLWLIRSDGARWVNGARDDTANPRILSYVSGIVRVRANAQGGANWAASTAYAVGAIHATAHANTFVCTTAGTSGATAPAWPTTPGATVTDGSVVWLHIGEASGLAADLAFLPFAVPDAWVQPIYQRHRFVPWAVPFLDADGDLVHAPSPKYLDIAGQYGMAGATTPSSTALDIAGDIDIRVRVAPLTWTPSAARIILDMGHPSSGSREWHFYLDTGSSLAFAWLNTAGGQTNVASTAGVGGVDGQEKWVRVTLDVDNGASGYTARFYTSDDGSTWTQLGSAVTGSGVTNIRTANANLLQIGRLDGGTGHEWRGKVFRAEVRRGIDGTMVANFDPKDAAAGAGSFTAPTTGETWTISDGGRIATDCRRVLGVDGESSLIPASIGGAFATNRESFEFALEEA